LPVKLRRTPATTAGFWTPAARGHPGANVASPDALSGSAALRPAATEATPDLGLR